MKEEEIEENVYSDYWLNDSQLDQYIESKEKSRATFSLDLIRLASYRRVISNYVRILTRKSIPVQFTIDEVEPAGLTTGNVVYITSSIRKKKDLDWTIGLALHEGSHIDQSDWEIVRKLYESIPFDLKEKAKKKNLTVERIASLCKHMFNVIEDRYVDSYVFKNAPGYRGYYESMYDKLWNNELLGEVLKSKMYRLSNIASYVYRITNLTNTDTDLDALPNLRKIAEYIDIPNILRLSTTKDRLEVSFKVVEMIIDSIEMQVKEPDGIDQTIQKIQDVFDILEDGNQKGGDRKNEDKKDTDSDGHPQESADDDDGDDEGDSGGDDGDDEDKTISEDDQKSEDKSSSIPKKEDSSKEIKQDDPGNTSDFKPTKLKKLQKEIEKQEQSLMRDYDSIKESVTEQEKAVLDIIEKTGIVLVPVGMGYSTPNNEKPTPVDCIVVHKMTKELIMSGPEVFPFAKYDLNKNPLEKYEKAINEGFILGKLLGRKLQIRGEINRIKYIRKTSGKIERRLLAGIGAGLEDIFHRIVVEKYNKARLHISVDASGSMEDDSKWIPTMKCVTAICVAASMIENLRVSVSIRATHELSDRSHLPYIVLAYDSEVDKINKIRYTFPYLGPSGATPEGLAFESIVDEFIVGNQTHEQDHYFLNLSDGEPCYSLSGNLNQRGGIHFNYEGESATLHTKNQIDKIRAKGVNVLSYFIRSNVSWLGYNPLSRGNAQIPYNETLKLQFQKMYGRDAKFIDVTNIVDIAKTINQLFLTRE